MIFKTEHNRVKRKHEFGICKQERWEIKNYNFWRLGFFKEKFSLPLNFEKCAVLEAFYS